MEKAKNAVRMGLIDLGLPKSCIHYLEDLIKIFTERSDKLPESATICPDILELTGPLRNTSCIHIYGHPTSGKTALASHIINCIDPKLKCLWVDSTFQFDPSLIKNKDSLFVFPSVHLAPLEDVAGNYAVVIIDDFASIQDPQNISKVIGACKRSNTMLIALDQVRINIQNGGVPQAMRTKLVVLFDVSMKMQRAENRTHYTTYQAVIERHRSDPTRRSKYMMVHITKKGKVINDKEIETINKITRTMD